VILESSFERSRDCASPNVRQVAMLAAATMAKATTTFMNSALPINCSTKRMDVSITAVVRLLDEPCGARGVAGDDRNHVLDMVG
jgi:hypothetical protein